MDAPLLTQRVLSEVEHHGSSMVAGQKRSIVYAASCGMMPSLEAPHKVPRRGRAMARERCNDLCSKATTGACALCDKLDERDRFEKYFWRFFCWESFWTPHDFVLVIAPSFFSSLALGFLVGSVFWKFLYKGDFSSVLPAYLAIIALSIALASITFTYSRTKDDEEVKALVRIGELFIRTALLLIFALLITWEGVEVQTLLKKGSLFETLGVIISLGNGTLLVAAISFYAGITSLHKHVISKLTSSRRRRPPEPVLFY